MAATHRSAGGSSPAMQRLVSALRRLPGVGEKSAARLAYFLLGAPDELIGELSDAIARIKTDTVICESCFNLGVHSPCAICANPSRDAACVCVVEEPADLSSIEQSGSFKGLYHVLGGALSPIDGMGPETLRIGELHTRVQAGGTAHYIADRLKNTGVTVTRIAYGMPLGGDLEYADHVTIGRSVENRRTLE